MPTQPETRSSIKFVERWQSAFDRNGRLPTAFLFAGPTGSGKKEAAEAIVQTLLGRIENVPDLIRIQPVKNSIKIEIVRELIGRLSLKPFENGRIVILIEEADAMTEGAANALLKTLEEPPDYVLFILMTTRPEGLPSTVRSRCQQVSFQIREEALRRRLHELLAEWGDDLKPLFEGTARGFSAASRLAEAVAGQPERFDALFDILRAYWRDLTVLSSNNPSPSLLFPEMQEAMTRITSRKPAQTLFEEMDLILETERAIEGNVNKTLALERLFARLIS